MATCVRPPTSFPAPLDFAGIIGQRRLRYLIGFGLWKERNPRFDEGTEILDFGRGAGPRFDDCVDAVTEFLVWEPDGYGTHHRRMLNERSLGLGPIEIGAA